MWLVGRLDRTPWEVEGVFSTEEKAIAACRNETFFIAPIEVDKLSPDESIEFPGSTFIWRLQPEHTTMKVGSVEVDLDATGRGTVKVNGNDTKARRVTIHALAGELPEIMLQVVPT